jgi:hypothetical protein
VEQAEQAAAGEFALQRAGERGRERLPHRRACKVSQDSVDETLELQLAGTKPTSESSVPEKAFANARSVAVAASLLSAT